MSTSWQQSAWDPVGGNIGRHCGIMILYETATVEVLEEVEINL